MTPEQERAEARIHELKTWPYYFEKVITREKTFEIRNNDRDFREGDTLFLKEWDPDTKLYSGRDTTVKVTFVTEFDQKLGNVVMGIKLCNSLDREEQLIAENNRLLAVNQMTVIENAELTAKVAEQDKEIQQLKKDYSDLEDQAATWREESGN